MITSSTVCPKQVSVACISTSLDEWNPKSTMNQTSINCLRQQSHDQQCVSLENERLEELTRLIKALKSKQL